MANACAIPAPMVPAPIIPTFIRQSSLFFGACFETEDQKYGMAFFLDKNKEKVKEPFKNC